MKRGSQNCLGRRFNFVLEVLILSFILPIPSLALITFERTYGGAAPDLGRCVQQTTDGGYVIAGHERSFSLAESDVFLIKTDSLGDTLWMQSYGDNDPERGYSVQQTSDGGYIIAGCRGCSAGSSDVYLVRTDSLGSALWTKTYGDTADEWAYSVQQTTDGGYVIAGYTESFGAGQVDFYLIKTDSLGDSLWARTYGDTAGDGGRAVQQTSDGGYIIAGWTLSFGAGGSDVYLIKTDSLGNALWTRTYGGVSSDAGYSVQQTSDGGYIIAGQTMSFGPGASCFYLVKTDSVGDSLWTNTYGTAEYDMAYSVQQTSDGGYVIAGQTGPPFSGPWDVFLVKTDSLGGELWTATYGDTATDEGYSVQQTNDGGYIVVGATLSFGAGSWDVYLIKTDEDGMLGLEEAANSKFKMKSARLLQNRPNPFHLRTVIRYETPATGHVSLKVYDIAGRLMETLVDEIQTPGSYQVEWEDRNQPSGIYFYCLESEYIKDIKKMVLLR